MRSRGFSLIELMMVVAIIAIIAAVALPSFRQYVIRSARTEARNALLEVAALQERYRYSNPGYATTLTALGITASPYETAEGRYTVTLTDPTAVSFTVSATPVSGKGQESDSCGTLTLSNSGVKGSTSSDAKCWK
jgi:type IV pilus assembly protein PilE